jgi:hypothetical protein
MKGLAEAALRGAVALERAGRPAAPLGPLGQPSGNRFLWPPQGQGCPVGAGSSKSPSGPWKHKREAEGRAGPFPPVGAGAAASTHAGIGGAPWSTLQTSAAARAVSLLRIAGVPVQKPMLWRLRETSGAFEGAAGPEWNFCVNTSKAPAPPDPRHQGTL